MPWNDALKNTGVAAAAAAITHIGAHTLTDPGTGTNANAGEATGGGYVRQAVAWGTAAAGVALNTGALVIPVDTGTYGFLTKWTASTGNTNNFRGYMPMGGAAVLKGFGSVDTSLANDTLFSVGHGLVDTNRVMLYNVFAETLPTGLTEGTIYFVVSATTNTFKVSLTSGGAAVDITAVGGGEFYWQQVVWEQFNAPGNITVAIGALALDLGAM
jgi:hypothetical protein